MLALRELVAALDRRVRRLEDAGETAIVREACVLRQEAVTRIEALTGADGGGDPADRAAAAANPTGDGAPSPTATGLRPTTTDPPEHAPPEPASPDGARS